MNFHQQSIGENARALLGQHDSVDSLLMWPPDIFALAASLLSSNGAYRIALTQRQTPPEARRIKEWVSLIETVSASMRSAIETDKAKVHPQARRWLSTVLGSKLSMSGLEHPSARNVRRALLGLLAIADEAVSQKLVPTAPGAPVSPVTFTALLKLAAEVSGGRASTLTRRLPPFMGTVLPKMHTPQRGMTMRSLSHNLAFIPSTEVKAEWYISSPERDTHFVNLLILPWPLRILPTQFRMNSSHGNTRCDHVGYFDFAPSDYQGAWENRSRNKGNRSLSDLRKEWKREIKDVILQARESVGSIDGIVFPELSLTPREYKTVLECLQELDLAACFLVSGVADDRGSGSAGVPVNTAFCNLPGRRSLKDAITQTKHHRWKLDSSQISQYGLGSSLDTTCDWWESTPLLERRICFFSLHPWFTFSVLVCEDLARQDPAAQIIRAVGPNLLIALLMDGPQLASRWPARYATVFADDPGSSVLTLTSLGMTLLSKAHGRPQSRTVALWKDSIGGTAIEIDLPVGARGLVLSLVKRHTVEYTIDGRPQADSASCLHLAGVHPV